MTDWTHLMKNLETRGFSPKAFATKEEAADYLDSQIDGVSVAFGGSMTVQEMELYPRLAAHNSALWHWNKDALAPPTAWPRPGRSSTSTGLATGWPPPSSATSGSISWWAETRSPRTLTRPCGGHGTLPPPKTAGGWG